MVVTVWDCHRRAFAHFGGVARSSMTEPRQIGAMSPRVAVPPHPEAAAFADHYGFTIDVLAPYRPAGKGRVERQVMIVRDQVLAGRHFHSIAELDRAFTGWLPIRRVQVHRTHGQVIGVRAEVDRAALRPLPAEPYLVADSIYGGSARTSWSPSRRVCTRFAPTGPARPAGPAAVGHDTVTIHSPTPESDGQSVLAVHRRAPHADRGLSMPITGEACRWAQPRHHDRS